jgi:hypothetical protein
MDRYSKYAKRHYKALFTRNHGFNHMAGGLHLFGGLNDETLELETMTELDAQSVLNDLRDDLDETNGSWQERLNRVVAWIREDPQRPMAFMLAANKFNLEIRSGTTCAYYDIEGDSYQDKAKWLVKTHGASALSNFLLASTYPPILGCLALGCEWHRPSAFM